MLMKLIILKMTMMKMSLNVFQNIMVVSFLGPREAHEGTVLRLALPHLTSQAIQIWYVAWHLLVLHLAQMTGKPGYC